MRFWAVLAVFCLAARITAQAPATTPTPATKDPATLEGRVVNAVTGEPLRKVNLSLFPSARQPGAAPAAASTDAEGKFKFENLDPGVWRLRGERTGFLSQEYGSRAMGPGTPITLSAGQKMKDLEFKLTPQGNISGKVLDEDGEPLQGAFVSAMKVSAYGKQPMMTGGEASNDVGEFRVGNLAPGKYVVRAAYRRFGGMGGAIPPSTDGRGSEGYLPTFYPGVADLSSAAVVEVGPGQAVSGINVQLRKGRLYRVRGKVLGVSPDSGIGRGPQVSVQPRERRSSFMGMASGGMIKKDGSFEIAGIQPGSYWVAVMRFERQPVTLGRVPVDVADADIEEVVISARPPLELSGSIKFEGDGTPPKFSGNLFLRSADQGYGANCPVKEDLTFTCEGVSHDKYGVSLLGGMPDGAYLKRVRLGSTDMADRAIDLSDVETAPAVELLISLKAATVEGVVLHEGKPYAGSFVVAALEDGPSSDRLGLSPATADQNGRYTLKNLPPGNYRIYALDDVVYQAATDPDFLKPYQDKAVKVKVSEGAREQAELKLIRPEQ